MLSTPHVKNPDIILMNSGIMAAHSGALLKQLVPCLSVHPYEVTDGRD
jgi:hypothetical protein